MRISKAGKGERELHSLYLRVHLCNLTAHLTFRSFISKQIVLLYCRNRVTCSGSYDGTSVLTEISVDKSIAVNILRRVDKGSFPL